MTSERRRRHIRGGGRAFIPLDRMRRIRWEEAVLRACAKREGRKIYVVHSSCHCGSDDCLGLPWPMAIKDPG